MYRIPETYARRTTEYAFRLELQTRLKRNLILEAATHTSKATGGEVVKENCCSLCQNKIIGAVKCKRDYDQCVADPKTCLGIAKGLYNPQNQCLICPDFTSEEP